jgi:anaerobic magnesium-protoporphyrin IX monomethyl ester cyclase
VLNQCYIRELNKAKSNTFPLGLLSIAAYLKARINGLDVKIIDGILDTSDIESFKPDIIGISLLSPFFTLGCQKAKELKNQFPEIPILFGGHHISYVPSNLPKECDAGVIGEGEEIFFQICKLMDSKGKLEPCDLAGIKSIVYWENGVLKRNEISADLLKSDEIPLLNNYDLCTFKNPLPFDYHIVATRGCPYRCRFCSSSPFWKKVRYYDIRNVIGQIEYVVERFHPHSINFYDDLMIANMTYLKSLHDEMLRKKLHLKTMYTCWVAGKHFNDEVAILLKEMNFAHVSFGIESGSPEVYRYLKGSWNSPEINAQAVRLAHAHQLKVNVSVIVGAPIETASNLKQTYEYLKSLPIDSGSVGLLKPFPGTQLWEEAKKNGFVSDSINDWSSIESDDILSPNTIFLGEKASRSETDFYYQKIQKMLRSKFLRSLWKSRLGKMLDVRNWPALVREKLSK